MAQPRDEGPPESELVDRARKGDHAAFQILVERYQDRVYGLARRILRDPELARDAVQDAYIRAWRDLPGLRDPERFDAWLHRLTVNACIDNARKRRRRPIEVDIEPIALPAVADAAGLVADRDQLERAFRRLTIDQRAVFVLHHYVGLPLVEIAELLEIPAGTARSRLHYAIAGLRDALVADAEPGILEGRPA